MKNSSHITEELIVELNQYRTKLQKLFDQLSYEEVANMEDLNPYREWIGKVTKMSYTLINGLDSEVFEDIINAKGKEQRYDQMADDLQHLEIENEQLKSVIGDNDHFVDE